MSGLNPNLPSLPTQQEVKILPNTLISQLDPIEKNRNIIPLNRDMLVELVEFPLLKPCQMLWDKGIRTMATSANKKDLQSGYAYLIIDWDTLSEENRAIAKGCATRIVLPEEGDVYLYGQTVKERVIRVDPQPHYDGRGFITIAIPLHELTTVSEVEDGITEIADKFKTQPATWVDEYSLEEMKQLYGMQEHDEVNPRDFVEIGFYYDEKSKKFFWSKDLFHLKYGQQEGVAQDSQKE